MVIFDEARMAQLAKFTLLTSTLVPWDLFRSFKVSSDAEEGEWGAESKGKLPHLFIPSKTAAWIPECAVKELLLGRIL